MIGFVSVEYSCSLIQIFLEFKTFFFHSCVFSSLRFHCRADNNIMGVKSEKVRSPSRLSTGKIVNLLVILAKTMGI